MALPKRCSAMSRKSTRRGAPDGWAWEKQHLRATPHSHPKFKRAGNRIFHLQSRLSSEESWPSQVRTTSSFLPISDTSQSGTGDTNIPMKRPIQSIRKFPFSADLTSTRGSALFKSLCIEWRHGQHGSSASVGERDFLLRLGPANLEAVFVVEDCPPSPSQGFADWISRALLRVRAVAFQGSPGARQGQLASGFADWSNPRRLGRTSRSGGFSPSFWRWRSQFGRRSPCPGIFFCTPTRLSSTWSPRIARCSATASAIGSSSTAPGPGCCPASSPAF